MTSKDDGNNVDRSRLHMANERTFLAWLRTSLVIIGLGFVVARLGFLTELFIGEKQVDKNLDGLSLWLGIIVIIYGIILTVYALKIYVDTDKSIEVGEYTPKRSQVYSAGIGLMVFGVIIISFLLFMLS